MENRFIRASAIAATALFAMGIASHALAEEKKGTDTVTLSEVYAVDMTGARDPSGDAACKEKYTKDIGKKVTTKYAIDTKTLMMQAESTVFDVPVVLHPLGISGSYSFMSDGVPKALADQGVTRVIFSLHKDFTNPQSNIMATLNAKDNCVMSNLAP